MRYDLTDKSKNQTFRLLLGEDRLDVEIRTFKDVAYVSYILDDEYIIKSTAVVSGIPVLPDNLERKIGGRLMFVDIDDLPISTERFDGISCYLTYEGFENG